MSTEAVILGEDHEAENRQYCGIHTFVSVKQTGTFWRPNILTKALQLLSCNLPKE